MSLRTSIAEEIRRTPVAAMCGLAGVVIAALSLAVAWAQVGSVAPSPNTAEAPVSAPVNEISLRNVALIVAYFVSITVAAALFLRAVARKHDVTAFFASIPLLALTNFSSILIIYLAPPRPLSPQLFVSAHDLVFYASAAIVIAFCGKEVLANLASTPPKAKAEEKPTEAGGDGMSILFAALIVLAVWSWLVFAGQTRLTRTLLPEITHPADTKSAQSGQQP
jgi:glucan phosphoethanolaminetransferase (alkaline phosphatase superfamily)